MRIRQSMLVVKTPQKSPSTMLVTADNNWIGTAPSVRFYQRAPMLIVALMLTCAAAPSIDDLRTSHARQTRVASIARRILTSNLESCSIKREDYGFNAASPDWNAPETMRHAWVTALQLGEGSTVISVFPDGPAQLAGLKVGDEISAANGINWSQSAAAQEAFRNALTTGVRGPVLHLTIRREKHDIEMELRGHSACDLSIVAVSSGRGNASASGNMIVVDAGLEQLLSVDDELAFIIAHEAAHIFLGDSGADQRDAIHDATKRFAIEKAADMLGIRLMLRAGYAPEVASSANAKVEHSLRGPIARLLNYHGSYMPTKERSAFLVRQAAEARSEYNLQPR